MPTQKVPIHSVTNLCAFEVLKQGPCVFLVRQDLLDLLDLSLVFLPSQKEGRKFNPPALWNPRLFHRGGGNHDFVVRTARFRILLPSHLLCLRTAVPSKRD
jgi:hypothetical protein